MKSKIEKLRNKAEDKSKINGQNIDVKSINNSTSREAPKDSAFQKIADIRASLPPLIERGVGAPFAADVADKTTNFMNRGEITIRLEKQFCAEVLQLLERFAHDHPEAKLHAGTFNV